MSKTNVPRCKHCGKAIRWTENLGWVHGKLGEGLFISCEDDENLAEVEDESKV